MHRKYTLSISNLQVIKISWIPTLALVSPDSALLQTSQPDKMRQKHHLTISHTTHCRLSGEYVIIML